MPCHYPMTAYQDEGGGPLVFKRRNFKQKELTIPCGQCIGCRLERSRQWAMRCVLEAQSHERNCFVTLTYNEDQLPQFGSLDKTHLTKFFKRLRKKFGHLRYFACGEYGDNTQRAHYHACIFGIDFSDKTEFRKIGEHTLYISEQLNQIWGHGNTSIGELTFETAAYTARYVMKKRFGNGGQQYVRVDTATGEIIPLEQPYAVMSLRSAIAKQWLHQYHGDIYHIDKDFLHMRGKKMKPPKYFDQLYDAINPERLGQIKQIRMEKTEKLTYDQLRAREKITRARILHRSQM